MSRLLFKGTVSPDFQPPCFIVKKNSTWASIEQAKIVKQFREISRFPENIREKWYMQER